MDIKTKDDLYGIDWHELSTGNLRFTKEDVKIFNEKTHKKAIWNKQLTNDFKEWISANFDREEPLKTPRFLKTGGRHILSCGKYYFTIRDIEMYQSSEKKNAFKKHIYPSMEFKQWLIDEIEGKHKKPEKERYKENQTKDGLIKLSPERRERFYELFSNYGEVYFPNDIKEDVDTIVGEDDKKDLLDDFFLAFSEFKDFSTAFKDVNLFPSFTFLLYGASGTGKTSLTRAFAKKYNLPIIVIETSRLVSSLLGDTLKNINRIFDSARDYAKNESSFILFFDEIDSLGAERSIGHSEVGEIKRATITFMQSLDRLTYENVAVIVFGATNHEYLLDKAIWRRFGTHLSFNYPTYHQRLAIIQIYIKKLRIIMERNANIRKRIDIDEDIEKNIEIEYHLVHALIKENNLEKYKEFPEINDEQKPFWELIGELLNDENNIFYITFGQTGSDIERAFKNLLFTAVRTGEISLDMIKDYHRKAGSTYEKERMFEKEMKKFNKL